MTHLQPTRKTLKPLSAAHQTGISFIGLIFWIALLGSAVVVGMQVTPAINEYLAIKKALPKLQSETSPVAIRNAFDKIASATYIDDFKGTDLIIENKGGTQTISFDYERKISLAGPVSLLIRFKGENASR